MFRNYFITGNTADKSSFGVTRTCLQKVSSCLKKCTITLKIWNSVEQDLKTLSLKKFCKKCKNVLL